MIIDGRLIAERILTDLTVKIGTLKERGINPTLAVILIGDNPASEAYVRQKEKAAEKIGASIIVDRQPLTVAADYFRQLAYKYDNDPAVHGLIIQRPVPASIGSVTTIVDAVVPEKDIDGFLPDSPFDVPVAAAIGEMLRIVHPTKDYLPWLQQQHIVVIGRGDTAGAPIMRYLEKQRCTTSLIYSQTPNPKTIMREGDIIISCVGKERIVTADAVKPGAILVSVGLWRDGAGKLHGDYDEADIQNTASYYTPTPGGVGPVNVACLMQNLVKACTLNS